MFGYIGLSISFIITVLILLIIFIRAQVSNKVKVILIPLVIWYGLILYSVPSNFMGWPKEEEPPEGSIIIAASVIEPGATTDGGIYFWVIHYPSVDELAKFSVNPEDFVVYMNTQTPKSYKIPYDRELHKKLLQAQEQRDKEKGILQYHRGGKDGKGRDKDGFEDNSGFRLLRPEDLLPKVVPGPEA